jgi:hypothetical protein
MTSGTFGYTAYTSAVVSAYPGQVYAVSNRALKQSGAKSPQRSKHIAAALLLAGALPLGAQAAVVHQQTLASWYRGSCSPCGSAGNLNARAFASFTLLQDTVLTGAEFAVFDSTHSGSDDLQVSVWSAPFGTQLHVGSFLESQYSKTGTDSTHVAEISLPGWSLAAGTYWLSLFGINGNLMSWVRDSSVGDDRHYNVDGTLIREQINLGFTLHGDAIAGTPTVETPLPGTLGLLGLGLAGIALTRRRPSNERVTVPPR